MSESTSWTADAASESRACVDTNVVVYAHDPSDPAKHVVAVALIKRLSESGRLVLSAQVFNEFSRIMMRPNRGPKLGPHEVAEILRELAATAEVVPITPILTFRALDAMPRHGFSFWDALIWAAAKEHGVEVVYTEDFQHGRDVEGVRIVNPFAAS
jgi:predicted nucleic acid-binding protein